MPLPEQVILSKFKVCRSCADLIEKKKRENDQKKLVDPKANPQPKPAARPSPPGQSLTNDLLADRPQLKKQTTPSQKPINSVRPTTVPPTTSIKRVPSISAVKNHQVKGQTSPQSQSGSNDLLKQLEALEEQKKQLLQQIKHQSTSTAPQKKLTPTQKPLNGSSKPLAGASKSLTGISKNSLPIKTSPPLVKNPQALKKPQGGLVQVKKPLPPATGLKKPMNGNLPLKPPQKIIPPQRKPIRQPRFQFLLLFF